MKKTTKIGLDAGSKRSGIVVISNNSIREGYNMDNDQVFDFILNESKMCDTINVVIEDVRPYNMRITDGIIATIKFLGEIEYRLKSAAIEFELIPRWEVKKWVFESFNEMVLQEISKNIIRHDAREKKKCDDRGKEYVPKQRSATFVYVDDRIVQKAMRIHWNIVKVSGFAQKAMYNLKDHSWQALAVVSLAIIKAGSTVLDNRPSVLT